MNFWQSRERLDDYLEGYSDEKIGVDTVFIRNSFRPPKETYALLPEFIDRIVTARFKLAGRLVLFVRYNWAPSSCQEPVRNLRKA